jgi:acetyl-CoA carboxylase alpha subunit
MLIGHQKGARRRAAGINFGMAHPGIPQAQRLMLQADASTCR